MTEEAAQREPSLREGFNGLRWLVRAGAPWRLMPNDLSPGAAVYQQTQRWLTAGGFEARGQDLREVLRVAQGRRAPPSAVSRDRRTIPSTPTSGARAGDDGAQRNRGSKGQLAVDTLGQLWARQVTPAHEQERMQVQVVAARGQPVTGESVEVAVVDQGYTGEQALQEAQAHGIKLEGIKLPEAKKGFVRLPRRWGVERSLGWGARFRRLARDYERLPETLAGLHFLAFAILLLKRFVVLIVANA